MAGKMRAGHTYRGGRRSEAMLAGEERSRQTNRTVPLRTVVGIGKNEEGRERELLDCGHLKYAADHFYKMSRTDPAYPGYDEMVATVTIGARRRCKECVE